MQNSLNYSIGYFSDGLVRGLVTFGVVPVVAAYLAFGLLGIIGAALALWGCYRGALRIGLMWLGSDEAETAPRPKHWLLGFGFAIIFQVGVVLFCFAYADQGIVSERLDRILSPESARDRNSSENVESAEAPEPDRKIVEQPTFPEPVFEDRTPGEIIIGRTDFGPIIIVIPSEEIWSGLERVTPRTRGSTYETYEPEYDLFIVWAVYDFDGPKCLLQVFPKGYDELLENWEGGFYDSCRDLYFDYGGRLLDVAADRPEPDLRKPRYEPAGNGFLRLLEENALEFEM